jgi:nitric oxide reductase large subunit
MIERGISTPVLSCCRACAFGCAARHGIRWGAQVAVEKEEWGMENPRTRAILLFMLVLTFGVLLFGGYLMDKEKPPIPDGVVIEDGKVLFSGEDITQGQNYFFSRGGQHIGSIWGHGAYLAPDWSADYLHRMGLFLAARHLGKSTEEAETFTQANLELLDSPSRARLTALVTEEIKKNRYNASSGQLTFTQFQAEAHESLVRYYTTLFHDDNERMGLQPGIVTNKQEGRLVTNFFSWLAWAAGTNRLDETYTYTSNWPYDPLVGNQALPGALIWSIVSVVLLILGIAGAIFVYQRYVRDDDYADGPVSELAEPTPTASQRVTLAYFLIAIVLFVIQVAMGSLTGHFTVEGTSLFGMLIWLALMTRAIRPALAEEQDTGGITHLLLYSAISIPAFYMAGLLYGEGSHLSNAEYWRWWVVHLWVEGFLEVFATVVMAFLLGRINVVSARFALRTVYFSIFLYLGGGVIGTFHHLYWTGAPTPIIALGAVFSALEVVPLALLGFEAVHNLRAARSTPDNPYRWPIYFFISVAFWNMLGAGVFGFLINPPIVLYYIQGINMTPLHAHTAMFGVYGLLAISLMLFSMRHIVKKAAWSDDLLKWSFWGLNGGLALMTVVSLMPSGFYQFYYAVRDGLWYARSPEIASGEVIRALSWARIGPDLVFWAGATLLLIFVVRAIWLSRATTE